MYVKIVKLLRYDICDCNNFIMLCRSRVNSTRGEILNALCMIDLTVDERLQGGFSKFDHLICIV